MSGKLANTKKAKGSIEMDLKIFLKKHGLTEGSLVDVSDGNEKYTGFIIPSNDDKLLVLKLKSGYNIGIAVERIKDVKKLHEEKAVGKAEKNKIEHKPGLQTIALLHTGGTIASRVDYKTGAVYATFNEEDLLSMYPEITNKCNIVSKHISNMWSDDMRFRHYQVIAENVEAMVKKGVKGVIIGHGTDTMAYSAAALAFMLENVQVPVLLVGAQRSSDRGSSDAAMNLDCAAEFILKTDFAGVAICMHNDSSDDKCAILPACKTRKMHSSRRDAFRPINDTAIATVDYRTKEIKFLKKEYPRKDSSKKFRLMDKMEDRVALLKITTNMFPEQFSFYAENKFKGVVIEGTGLGHTPGFVSDEHNKMHKKLWEAIEELSKKCVVVMTTQTLYGRLQMHVYDKGVELQKLGITPGGDMLPETAFEACVAVGELQQGRGKGTDWKEPARGN